MALDLANGYIRKDGSSASNVYYGYSVDPNATDTDKVFAIRRVTNAAGVETIKWTNGNQLSYTSDWSNRTYSFTSPGGNLNLTATTSTTMDYRVASFSWSEINGVSKYLITALDSSGRLIQVNGLPLNGHYVNRGFSSELLNLTTWTQYYLTSGTCTFTVRAENVSGFTSSTVTINFPS